MKPQQVGLLAAIYVFALLLSLTTPSVHAKVTGPCENCHTMHNSQDGVDRLSEPQPVLLVEDCIGCHSASDGSTWKDDVTGAPIVYNTNTPQYGYFDGTYYHGLAGGNFYWVKTDDSKGHNVFPGKGDGVLKSAPGGFSCFTNSCHDNLHLPYNVTDDPGLYGRQGCTGCHMLDDVNQPTGFHHADDGGPGSVINEPPWYRFLKGHMRANKGSGVSGIEDTDWQATHGPADHNEYLGEYDEVNGNTSDSWSLLYHHTMTAFCCGCHGTFHMQQEKSGDTWIRHPSDAIIPNSGEYTGYTVYDPNVPVARQTLNTVSSSVTSGAGDMVMCLSCHKPHGSPYPDMLRWNYDDMEVASGGTGGCFKCHTQKN